MRDRLHPLLAERARSGAHHLARLAPLRGVERLPALLRRIHLEKARARQRSGRGAHAPQRRLTMLPSATRWRYAGSDSLRSACRFCAHR